MVIRNNRANQKTIVMLAASLVALLSLTNAAANTKADSVSPAGSKRYYAEPSSVTEILSKDTTSKKTASQTASETSASVTEKTTKAPKKAAKHAKRSISFYDFVRVPGPGQPVAISPDAVQPVAPQYPPVPPVPVAPQPNNGWHGMIWPTQPPCSNQY